MTQEALKLALECAERCEAIDGMYSWSATITAIEEALAQTQEPVAWRWENRGEDNWLNKYIYLDNGAPDYPEGCTPLYTAPPQRTWVDLTDEEIQVVAKQARSKDHAVTLTNKLLRDKNA